MPYFEKKLKFNIDFGLKFDTPPKWVPFHDRYTIRRELKALPNLETSSSLLKIVRGPLKRKFTLPTTIGFQVFKGKLLLSGRVYSNVVDSLVHTHQGFLPQNRIGANPYTWEI